MVREFDRDIARISSDQHGVISTRQLVQLGLDSSAIAWRIRRGRLYRIHRGVYAVGHTGISRHSECLAAVLALGAHSLISAQTACELWNLPVRSQYKGNQIHVVTPSKHVGICNAKILRSKTLVRSEYAKRFNIPLTSVARTLVDLSDEFTAHQIANVMYEADFRKRMSVGAVRNAIERNRNRRRISIVIRALDLHRSGSAGTRSLLEDQMLAYIESLDIPSPRVNERFLFSGIWYELDFFWPEQKLCIEVDGHGHQRARTKREDARRDSVLKSAGIRVIRFSGNEIKYEPNRVIHSVFLAVTGT